MEKLHYYTDDGSGMHRITEEEAKKIEERNRKLIYGSPENREQVQVVICVKAE